MWRFAKVVCVLPVLSMLSLAPAAPAATMQTFVMTVAGQSVVGPAFQCSTFRVPSPSFELFGSAGVAIPLDGLAPCGIAGGPRVTTAGSGTVNDTTSLSTSFNDGANSFTGAAAAKAGVGSVGAYAQGSFSGATNGLIVKGAQAYGRYTLTGLQANVNADSARFRFAIDGSIAVSAPAAYYSQASLAALYRIDDGSSHVLVNASVFGSTTLPSLVAPSTASTSGFTLAPGSLSGSGHFDSYLLPVTPGRVFDLTFALLAYVLPGVGAVNEVDFLATATLSAVELYYQGRPVNDFLLTAADGVRIGPSGVVVPLPGALASCLGAIAVAARWRRARPRHAAGRPPTWKRDPP